MTFLETEKNAYYTMNELRAAYYSGDKEPTHTGLAIVAADTGLVLLAQRSYDATDDLEVRESWEFPGGGIDPNEQPWEGAVREFDEEVGAGMSVTLPDGRVTAGWQAGGTGNSVYQGYVYVIPTLIDFASWSSTDEVQNVGWYNPSVLTTTDPDIKIRPELQNFDTSLLVVSGNEETDMSEPAPEQDLSGVAEMMDQEPLLTSMSISCPPIPIHGVMAPEGAESGDARGFNEGAVTARPLRLPFSWQKYADDQHKKSVVVGSVDRLMRKDGLIHWEGCLMPCDESEDFLSLLEFFGQFGVSIDGDRGSLDATKSNATGVTWFDAVRAAGLTAVAIPAFAEAYVALGPHPDMPDSPDDSVAMTASGSMVGAKQTYDRGPGWVTNPQDTERLHKYWTEKGQPGYAKIAWGTDGDWTRCVALVGEKIAENSPAKSGYIKQICSQWHHDALGYWPGQANLPGNPTTEEIRSRHGSDTVVFSMTAIAEDEVYCAVGCGNPALWSVSTDDPNFNGLYCDEHAPEYEAQAPPVPGWAKMDDEGSGWEAVLTSSMGSRALPPASYFEFHEESGALVIEEPDDLGFRATYGYMGEWGVCHIGKDGRCVEVPEDDTGEFPDFHLGRTKVMDEHEEKYIHTGVMTYKVDHRDAETILSETAEQQHFDNIANAWCAVRLGQDDRGIWFSGVVLPGISDNDLVVIEAAGQVSGEWKYGSLRAVQCVNVPGFAVLRASAAYDDDGDVIALVASSFGRTSDCAATPAEMMAALASADAEVRFARMKKGWS